MAESSTAPTKETALKFVPFMSAVEVTFWHMLGKYKLEKLKLDDTPIPVLGVYQPSPNSDIPARLCLGEYSYSMLNDSVDHSNDEKQSGQVSGTPDQKQNMIGFGPGSVRVSGLVRNANTMEDFKMLCTQPKELVKELAQKMWNSILDGSAIETPALVLQFMALTFADMKHHRYYYWFSFPAIIPPKFYLKESAPAAELSQIISSSQLQQLISNLDDFIQHQSQKHKYGCPPCFLVQSSSESSSSSTPTISCHPISAYKELISQNTDDGSNEVFLAFFDPCSLPSNGGWPLRNLMLLMSKAFQVTKVRVICVRADLTSRRIRQSREDPSQGASQSRGTPQSIVLSVSVSSDWMGDVNETQLNDGEEKLNFTQTDVEQLKVVGWEKKRHCVNLKKLMDPHMLASNSVDLNLKLMRWRALPSLDLPLLARTKCLLIGAGTLGCNVARCLLGWGIKYITFVDNGAVSYSNPVRQSLYTFEDCIVPLGKNSSQKKAPCAATRLAQVYPGVAANGVVLTIPMPGHIVNTKTDEEKRVKEETERLIKLIQDHDVIFLLTDSRESRWLPTLLCRYYDKLCINTALGFDSFVVMRHGHDVQHSSPSADVKADSIDVNLAEPSSIPLGCYFCNDVVAPVDSLKDRTLDQQCTVTRPGLAFMASALAVELCVALLHHPLGHHAPGDDKDTSPSSRFGIIPHQLRGFLTRYDIAVVIGHAFDKCTACSTPILSEYKSRGWDFILDVLNKPTYLEDLSGLTSLKSEAEAGLAQWDVDSVDDDSDCLL